MEKRRRKKVREEDRAAGIVPEEDKELDQLLDETIELFDESDKITDQKITRTRKKQRKQLQQFMQMNANMMQQHQQQTLALMQLMKRFAEK